MKLARFTLDGRTRIGKVVDDRVHDLTEAFPGAPASVTEALRAGPEVLRRLDAVALDRLPSWPRAEVRLQAPVPDPQKFLAIGLNYRDHLQEVLDRGGKPPQSQLWFNKQVSCIAGPFDEVHRPRVSTQLDYEAELGVVIGRRCRHVSEAEALSMVGGYLAINDVTARDWQRKTPTWTLGKSFDTHGPMGPWLVTPDEIADPQALQLQLWVNGDLRQKTNTSNMVFSIAEQIAYLSTVMTLEPGDVLATGTCSGAGFSFDPPRFLVPGDRVRVRIESLGEIENLVIDEPDTRLA
jgi:2-keto-4-pentenoate hydratase/2-oxohepta-3-ene-1,7-dioic acid hydratase in catechol pathway